MADADDDASEVLPAGTSMVRHWSFFLDDLPEDFGGGYAAGQFLLRSDGALLWRSVASTTSGGFMRWKAGPWKVFHRFGPDEGEAAVRAWLDSRRYQLGDDPNIPVDAGVSAEIPFSLPRTPGPPSRGQPWLNLIVGTPLLLLGFLILLALVVIVIQDPATIQDIEWWVFAGAGRRQLQLGGRAVHHHIHVIGARAARPRPRATYSSVAVVVVPGATRQARPSVRDERSAG